MADKYAVAEPEFEALQYTGSNAAAIKAMTDPLDSTAVTVRASECLVRTPTGETVSLPVGMWVFTSTLANPPVFLVENAAVARWYRKKP